MGRRAVSPIIATLLLVAITTVGGSIVFYSSLENLDISQISGTIPIESISILGYDARDASQFKVHDGGNVLEANSGGNGNGMCEQHERMSFYFKNEGNKEIHLAELRFGGTAYTYANTDALDSFGVESGIPGGTYDVWLSREGVNDVMLTDNTAVIESGDSATIVFALDKDYKIGRDTQLKLTTTNGNIFVSTIVIGTQIG